MNKDCLHWHNSLVQAGPRGRRILVSFWWVRDPHQHQRRPTAESPVFRTVVRRSAAELSLCVVEQAVLAQDTKNLARSPMTWHGGAGSITCWSGVLRPIWNWKRWLKIGIHEQIVVAVLTVSRRTSTEKMTRRKSDLQVISVAEMAEFVPGHPAARPFSTSAWFTGRTCRTCKA